MMTHKLRDSFDPCVFILKQAHTIGDQISALFVMIAPNKRTIGQLLLIIVIVSRFRILPCANRLSNIVEQRSQSQIRIVSSLRDILKHAKAMLSQSMLVPLVLLVKVPIISKLRENMM